MNKVSDFKAELSGQAISRKFTFAAVAVFAIFSATLLLSTQAAETWIDYADNHAEIQYLGGIKSGCDDFSQPGWALCTGQDGYFDNSYHYTNDIGSSFSFKFNGTGVKIWSDVSDHAGRMDVTIDGQPQGVIDYYSGPFEKQVMVYEKIDLPPGNHTFTATLTGKNDLSGGTFVGLDQVSILGTIGESAEPSTTPTPTTEPTTSPTPTSDPTPTLDPSPSPSPTLEPTPTVSPTPSPTPTGDLSKYDIDNSGTIGVGDLSRLIQDYPRQTGLVVPNSPADFNNSGRVDINDLSTLLRYWGMTV